MIVDRGDVTFGFKAVAATGLYAASLAVTEAATKTLGFAEADVLLAAKRGFVGGGVLTALTLGNPPPTAPRAAWEAFMLPAFINTTGALLLQGLDHFDISDVAKQSIRLALIGCPLWLALCSCDSLDGFLRLREGAIESIDDPAPPYSP